MKRLVIGLVVCLALIGGAFAYFAGETGARQEATAIVDSSSSNQMGYVLGPLPGEEQVVANTLEMTRLHLVAGDSIGPYVHSGAAIYFVESGSVVATIEPAGTAKITLMAGDPSVLAPEPTCNEGCVLELREGQWFTIDSEASFQSLAAGDTGAIVYVSSLTQESDPVEQTSDMGGELVVVRDSNHP